MRYISRAEVPTTLLHIEHNDYINSQYKNSKRIRRTPDTDLGAVDAVINHGAYLRDSYSYFVIMTDKNHQRIMAHGKKSRVKIAVLNDEEHTSGLVIMDKLGNAIFYSDTDVKELVDNFISANARQFLHCAFITRQESGPFFTPPVGSLKDSPNIEDAIYLYDDTSSFGL